MENLLEMMTYTCNPSAQEAETEASPVWDHLGICGEILSQKQQKDWGDRISGRVFT